MREDHNLSALGNGVLWVTLRSHASWLSAALL